MNLKQEFTDKLNELIPHWSDQGISMIEDVSIDRIKNLEDDFGFSFEENFYIYLTKINCFTDIDYDDWFSFWSMIRIKEENEDGSHPYPKNIIWFSDYAINLCSFGIHKIDSKIYSHYQTIDGIQFIANSFNEFVDLYLEDSHKLLR